MAVPQKITNGITVWASNFTTGHISKRIEEESQRDICIPVFIASFTMAKRWMQPASIRRWMNKQSVVFTNDQMLLILKKGA